MSTRSTTRLTRCQSDRNWKSSFQLKGRRLITLGFFRSIIVASFVDLNADQPAGSFFDLNGRAELIGVVSGIGRGTPCGGDVVAGEVFDNITGRTSVHILGKGVPGGGD